MSEVHLKQLAVTYLQLVVTCLEHLQKNKERMQKLKETGNSRHIYQIELDKACF